MLYPSSSRRFAKEQKISSICPIISKQYAKERNTERRDISSEALRKLMAYEWPGNVRELGGVLLRALVLTPSAILRSEDINIPQQDWGITGK